MDAVQILVERDAIIRLKARYWRYWDTKRFDHWLALFAEDATLTADFEVPEPGREMMRLVARGHQEFREKLIAYNLDTVTVHHGHTPEIDLLSPTEAKGIWPMHDLVERGGNTTWGHGHYRETYRKIDGAWRFASVHLTRLRLVQERRP